jgi:ubiquinone/menaquinone biosynthesis C-methylase UbiE
MSEEARRKWTQSAAAWIGAVREGDVNRTHLLDAPMLELAGDVRGLAALDIGCGEGRFCRMLEERGAATVGLDPALPLVAEARRLHPDGRYLQADAERLPFPAESFDLAVLYLVLIDVADYRAAIDEAARVLRPGGSLIVANMNPFASTREIAWYRDESGNKLHVAVVDYYEERAMHLEWKGIGILNWHRPMEAYMGAFLRTGLVLKAFEEPRPTLEAVERHPSMLDERRVPLLHVMRWERSS